MTLPRSSGCTRTSSTRPLRSPRLSTRTSSGNSTMPRTRCSRASSITSVSARRLRVGGLGGRLDRARSFGRRLRVGRVIRRGGALDGLVRRRAARRRAVLGRAVLGRAVLGRAVLGRAVLGRAVLGRAVLGRAVLGRAVLGRAVLGRAAPGSGALGVAAPGPRPGIAGGRLCALPPLARLRPGPLVPRPP